VNIHIQQTLNEAVRVVYIQHNGTTTLYSTISKYKKDKAFIHLTILRIEKDAARSPNFNHKRTTTDNSQTQVP